VAISLARGVPAPECLPVEELADCARAVIERDGRSVLSYGGAAGYGPLREWVAERHGVTPERVLLTNGSLQGFVFLANHFLGRGGGSVIIEAPTYDRPLKILAGLAADIVTVPVDDEGLDVDALAERLRDVARADFVYTIPTFQNPSGRTLSLDRRRRVVELAREHQALILEDDPYGLVRFEGEAPPTLFELDGGERVVYSSSFSKTVAPGARVGYLVLPPHLCAAIEGIAVQTYISPALLSQATVWEFLRRGELERNLERVCGLLRVRRDTMLDALDRHFPAEATWSRPEGGYFLWLDLPVDAGELLERATAAGVTFVKGSDFFPLGGRGSHSARFAFSFVSPREIEEGIERLGSLVRAPVAPAV
jgi:2-aminoadipate transaminase